MSRIDERSYVPSTQAAEHHNGWAVERLPSGSGKIALAMLPPDAPGSLDIWGHVNAYIGDGPLLVSAVIAPPGLLVGRGPHCDLRLDETTVSWDHLEIACRGRSVIAEDLGSSNGTMVNARPMERGCRLRSGDVLQVGSVRLTVALRGERGQETVKVDPGQFRLNQGEQELAAALVARYRASTSLVGRPATRAELAEGLNISERTVQRRLDSLVYRLRIGPHAGRDRSLLLAQRILEMGLDVQR